MGTSLFSRKLGLGLAFCGAAAVAAALLTPRPIEAASQATVATAWTEVHGSKLRLIAGPATDSTKGYLAGVEIVLAEGWKTYWRMPGDAGVPPQFNWDGSTNTAAIDVFYPAPIRLLEPNAQSV